MKSLVATALVFALGLGAAAVAQVPGSVVVTSLVGAFSLPINTKGPRSALLPLNGGTFSCSAGAATVANAAVNSGSIIIPTIKTAGGTVAALFFPTITPGTGFTVTCGGSDSSVYNYIILG